MAIITSPKINPALKASSIKPQPDNDKLKTIARKGNVNFFINCNIPV